MFARRILATLSLGLFLTGCAAKENTEGFNTYGGKPEVSHVMSVSQLVKSAETLGEKRVCVKGDITEVCARMGCWMMVVEGDKEVRVRFTESASCANGFFVPRNAAGHKVYMNGVVKYREISEEDRRHYAQDEGASQEEIEKIVGSEKEVLFFADAVMISDGTSSIRR
jgi:hypothetical protein